MNAMCPHCGFDLIKSEPAKRKSNELTPTEQRIFYYLSGLGGKFVSSKQIEQALNLPPSIRTHIFYIRQKGFPIVTRPGSNGYAVA